MSSANIAFVRSLYAAFGRGDIATVIGGLTFDVDWNVNGRRPTVDDNGAPLLETFIFDFSGDLYGETSEVSFFGFLRSEIKFDGLDALVVQMKRDEAEARALLAGVKPLSQLEAAIAF